MMNSDEIYFKGILLDEVNFDSEHLKNMFKYSDFRYYITFYSLVSLNCLRDNLLFYILDCQNSKFIRRYRYNKIKEVRPVEFNTHENMLTYHDTQNRFTLQFQRMGVQVYPSSPYDTNLNEALSFLSHLDRANLWRKQQ